MCGVEGNSLPASSHHAMSLSICIPTYERPDLLARALASVIGGSEGIAEEIEIIVSDDSRSEESSMLCERVFGTWVGRARYVQNRPGLGMVANFNRCVAEATGRYILILHDDDYLLRGGLRSIVAATLKKDQHPVLLFGVHVVDDTGKTMRRQIFAREQFLSADVAIRNVLSNSSYVRFPGVVAAADAYHAVGPFEIDLGGATDFEMWLRLFARYGVMCLPEATSAYSVHPEAHTAGTFHAGTIATLARIFERVVARGLLPAAVVRRCEADFFAQFILGGVYRQIRVGNMIQAREVMALADLPSVSALGPSRRWRPVQMALSGLLLAPGPLASHATRWLERIYMNAPILRSR